MKVVLKLFFFCVCRCFSYQQFPGFFYFQRALYYFIRKIFFRRTEAVTWRCSVKNISQISSENTSIGVFSFSKVARETCSFIKKRLRHRCFPVDFEKTRECEFNNTILQNMCKRQIHSCEKICHMEFLVTVYLTNQRLPWCLLNNQKKCLVLRKVLFYRQ